MLSNHSSDTLNQPCSKGSKMTMLFNTLVAGSLLLLTLPLFIIIPLIIRFQDSGNPFYRGARMGLNKNHFTIYKFRTLANHAESVLGAGLVSNSSEQLELPIGKFLRDTRIDELPQLLNVLKGDMNIIGPRPEREAVYEAHCRQIPGYDKRFRIKPGLIGYSQLFTPHAASKKTRTLIDNSYLRRKPKLFGDLKLLCYALFVLALALLIKISRTISKKFNHKVSGNKFNEKRQSSRVRHQESYIIINNDQSTDQSTDQSDVDAKDLQHTIISGEVCDITATDAYIVLAEPLPDHLLKVELFTRYHSLGQFGHRHKSIHCNARLKTHCKQTMVDKGQYHYIISLEDVSELNHLKLHKYFLYNSIC